MVIKLLNNTQKEQVNSLLSFYKFIYICNRCGSVYGTDRAERKDIHCPKCLLKINKEKRSEREQ